MSIRPIGQKKCMQRKSLVVRFIHQVFRLELKLQRITTYDGGVEKDIHDALDEVSMILTKVRKDIETSKTKMEGLEYDLSNIIIQRVNTQRRLNKYREQREMERAITPEVAE